MSSNEIDPIASLAKGTTDSILEKVGNKIKDLVKKFRDKDYFFVENEEIIEKAKNQRKKGELSVFKEYIQDKDLIILFQMGLTLRELENEKKDLEQLKTKIRNKHLPKGLHFAYFIQNGLFSIYLGNILPKGKTNQEIKLEVENFLKDIDKNVVFVNQYDKIDTGIKIRQIIARIDVSSPETFIISSIGSARKICDEIKEEVMKQLSGEYTLETYEQELTCKKIYFLNKVKQC